MSFGNSGPRSTVGLVISAYQGERFIDQTLAAVAAQSRLPDQVVVVDDASADSTAKRAARWIDVLPLDVVALPTNGGVARARNQALARLDTDLVAILDGDDVLLPDHLEVLADLHARKGGIVSARASFWTPGQPPRPYQRRIRGFVPPASRQLERLVRRNYVFIASMVSRADLDSVGGFTEGERSQDTTADWDLWLKLAARGVEITLAPFPTVLYRVVPGSMADDAGNLIECEILQLERSRAFLPPELDSTVDEAIAQRRSELRVLELAAEASVIGLARRAVGRGGGDWRNRARAASYALAPATAKKLLRRRGGW